LLQRIQLNMGGENDTNSTVQVTPSGDPIKINVADPVAVKHTLDEQIARLLTDELGYEEDNSFSNMKLFLGSIAVVLAAAAQFYPIPFPECRTFLVYAVIIYWIIHVVLQVVYSLADGDCIVLTRTPYLMVTTRMGRYDTRYDVTFGRRRKKLGGTLGRLLPDWAAQLCSARMESPPLAAAQLSVTDYFDVTGRFLRDVFYERISGLATQAETVGKSASHRD